MNLPDHVTAAFADQAALDAWLTQAATVEAERRAVAAAQADADQILADARAPFIDGAPTPEEPTYGDRLATVEDALAVVTAEVLGGAE